MFLYVNMLTLGYPLQRKQIPSPKEVQPSSPWVAKLSFGVYRSGWSSEFVKEGSCHAIDVPPMGRLRMVYGMLFTINMYVYRYE